MRVLYAPTELGAHILGFCCTIGAYLWAKYEGQTRTESGDPAGDGFRLGCIVLTLAVAAICGGM